MLTRDQAVADFRAASAAYQQAVAAVEDTWKQLRDPQQPWNQTVMRLLDNHQTLLDTGERVDDGAAAMRHIASADDAARDFFDRARAEGGFAEDWEYEDNSLRPLYDAQRLIKEHRTRLTIVTGCTHHR